MACICQDSLEFGAGFGKNILDPLEHHWPVCSGKDKQFRLSCSQTSDFEIFLQDLTTNLTPIQPPCYCRTGETGGWKNRNISTKLSPWFSLTFAVERHWPLVPGAEDSLGVRADGGGELHREAGRGVDGAQAVVCRAGVPPRVLSARLTQT